MPAEDIPLIPDPTRIWAQLPLGQAEGTGWKSTLASPGIQPGCTSTWILQLPWNQLWGPKNVQQNSSTNPWKIKTLMCLQSGPQSH